MNIWQIGFVVRSGVSALGVAFLLGYAAHYQWGFSRVAIRTDALMAALLIGTLVAIEFFWQEFAEAEEVPSPEGCSTPASAGMGKRILTGFQINPQRRYSG